MDELSSSQVNLCDPFWSPRLETNAQRAILHQWNQLEASGCIDNFRILAGEKEGFRAGWFFADSDAYKWLDAAARINARQADPRLASLMDDFIALLSRCQSPDGYLFTYNQIHFPGQRWVNLQIEHELYCHGHLIEAGVSHSQATGQSTLLDIAQRAADLLVHDFLEAGPQRTPGHEEVEIALLRLFHATGRFPYLDLAEHFLEQRGRTPSFALSLLRQNASVSARGKSVNQKRQAYQVAHPERAIQRLPEGNFAKRPPFVSLRWMANALSGKYFQQHLPIRQQALPVGHAVRFGYLETAIAMLQRARADNTLLPALTGAWERMVARRMYVTGGIGSLPALEGFGRDYELDPEFAYAETCAALACLFWDWQMALITAEAKYSDLFEWQLYNAAAVGMGWNGENYLYNNPLACRGGVTRKAWFAIPCCPSNLSRTWADLGRYIFSVEPPDLWIHQYIGSQARFDLGGPVQVVIESELPWNGVVGIKVSPSSSLEFTLHLRLPSWSAAPAVVIRNVQTGQQISVDVPAARAEQTRWGSTAQGYDPRQGRFLKITRRWSPGDRIELALDTPIVLRRAYAKVKGHRGKVALTRGPLVYCLESVDNPDVDIFGARLDPNLLRAEHVPNLFGGITVLKGQTLDGIPLTFIPYQLWANRGESQMTVWVNT
jgi:uncharacterized protein